MPFVLLHSPHSLSMFNQCMLIVVFLSDGVLQEQHLFNQQLPLTVPQLGASCRFYSQMVPQRDMSLIEIHETVSRSASQSGTAAEKNMK